MGQPSMRILLVVTLAGSLSACAGVRRATPATPSESVTCDATNVAVEFISSGDAASMSRIEDSAKRLSAILVSPAFHRQCSVSRMNRTGGRSIDQVCQQLSCSGPQSIRVALYHDERMKTLAFEKRGAVFINTAKQRAGTPANLAHEFAHVLGYSHQSFWGIARKQSVPYVVGTLVEAADPQ